MLSAVQTGTLVTRTFSRLLWGTSTSSGTPPYAGSWTTWPLPVTSSLALTTQYSVSTSLAYGRRTSMALTFARLTGQIQRNCSWLGTTSAAWTCLRIQPVNPSASITRTRATVLQRLLSASSPMTVESSALVAVIRVLCSGLSPSTSLS